MGIWQDTRISERFPRYWQILHNQAVAMFKIAKTIIVPDLSRDSPLEQLQRLHQTCRVEFKNKMRDNFSLEDFKKHCMPEGPTFLDVKVQLSHELLKQCIFCENQCRIDRTKGKVGACRVPETASIASAFEHLGEESILIPSGTIFFNGCTFHCVFCQNWDISQEWPKGDVGDLHTIDAEQLAAISSRLYAAGVKNINYVGGDPTSNLHVILKSLKYLDVNVCQLWNSNFYNSIEAVDLLLDVMDLWLPDFKYGNDECAKKYSNIDNYVEVLHRNLKMVYDQGSGEIIIRHLVLPSHVECCSKPILSWVAANLPKAVVNIMGQYRPEYKASRYPEIARRPSGDEMHEVRRYASELGIVWEHL